MIIVTMLGTGKYETTCYQWGEHTCETTLFPVALASWFPPDTVVKALVTDEAREKYGETLQTAVPGVEFVAIPSGKSEEELWQIFSTVAETLPEGEEVILDITHGFRSLPILTLLALSFLRIAKGIKLYKVFYGAYEARNQETHVSPVFDLTPFVTMLDWANATDRFLETGDARKIAPLIMEKRKNPLNNVAQGMTEVSESLALMRAKDVLENARKLQKKITAAKAEEWEAQHTPLKLLLERIETRFSPIAETDTLKAQWEQICWLSNHAHYPAAVSLAREWLVSVRVVVSGKPIFPVDKEERKSAERWLNNARRSGSPIPEEWTAAIHLWSGNLNHFRNDLMHWGMRHDPRRPIEINRRVKELPEQLRQAVKPLGIEVG